MKYHEFIVGIVTSAKYECVSDMGDNELIYGIALYYALIPSDKRIAHLTN